MTSLPKSAILRVQKTERAVQGTVEVNGMVTNMTFEPSVREYNCIMRADACIGELLDRMPENFWVLDPATGECMTGADLRRARGILTGLMAWAKAPDEALWEFHGINK